MTQYSHGGHSTREKKEAGSCQQRPQRKIGSMFNNSFLLCVCVHLNFPHKTHLVIPIDSGTRNRSFPASITHSRSPSLATATQSAGTFPKIFAQASRSLHTSTELCKWTMVCNEKRKSGLISQGYFQLTYQYHQPHVNR